MFNSKLAYNLFNKIYEKTLRLIHNDYENRFIGLLEINNEVTLYVKNNKKRMIEVHEYVNGL